MLKERGYEVTALDIIPDKYLPDEKRIVISDLTVGIPFKTESFDAVLCVEGIEHLSSTAHYLSLQEETILRLRAWRNEYL